MLVTFIFGNAKKKNLYEQTRQEKRFRERNCQESILKWSSMAIRAFLFMINKLEEI